MPHDFTPYSWLSGAAKLHCRPCDFVSVVFAAVVNYYDFTVAWVFLCTFEQTGDAMCDVFLLVVGRDNETNHGVKIGSCLWVWSSCENSCYDPNACDADGHKSVPCVKEAYCFCPKCICGLFYWSVTKYVGYYPLSYGWKIQPRKKS